MKRVLQLLGHILVTGILTLMTQVGGVIYILWILLIRKKAKTIVANRFARLAVLLGIYLLTVLFIVPPLAQLFGKEQLPYRTSDIRCGNTFYYLSCRNYVVKGITSKLKAIAQEARLRSGQDIQLVYLDAGFPFGKKAPLLPHLSHIDGRQVDIAFCYSDVSTGRYYRGSTRSLSGYGVFEFPYQNEVKTPMNCETRGYWQYSILGKFAFDWHANYFADPILNKALISAITSHKGVKRVFLEPHLKSRWQLGDKVRFHGCHAVRHDDHIHIDFN